MTSPPFRADHVGSLLRPAAVKAARRAVADGKMELPELRAIEDEAILGLIRRQEEIGLQGITDGEVRRAFFNYDFAERIDGVDAGEFSGGMKFGTGTAKARSLNVIDKVRFTGHPFLDQFRFLKEHTDRTAKWTIPSPDVFHFRFGREYVSRDVYPDMEDFFADVASAFKDAVAAFEAAGCEYLQIDECPIIYLCDRAQRRTLEERGDDPDECIRTYARMLDTAISGAKEMRVMVHLCRGNYRSTFAACGGYDPIADLLFGGVRANGFFLEYDSERAGGFEPLRQVGDDTMVVLGLITTKTPELENKDDVKRRIEAAAKFIPMERLCLSPQCGFASTEEGNNLTEDEQWRKLELVREIADEVWGGD